MAADSRSYEERIAEGMRVRREVLGAEYVDKNKGEQSRLQRDFAEYTVEQAWSAVWIRPGLERKTRSMLNLAMLTALGRLHELEVHMRGAITNGVTETEVSEILRQVGVYAGVPVAAEGFRVADKVFRELAATLEAR
jgi:4-carboxymuconolactone decarboxylase